MLPVFAFADERPEVAGSNLARADVERDGRIVVVEVNPVSDVLVGETTFGTDRRSQFYTSVNTQRNALWDVGYVVNLTPYDKVEFVSAVLFSLEQYIFGS